MDIIHFGAVQLRLEGTGNLQLELKSLSGVETQDLTAVAMSASTNRMPNVLSNFLQQRAQLKLYTEEIDEVFEIDRIIVYVKPIFSSYPQ